MKKYMVVLFVLAIACAFSVSAVMAADLEKYDFDGKFTMEMKKGLNFTRETPDEGSVSFTDLGNNVSVLYVENPNISLKDIDQLNAGLEAKGYKVVGTDGNLTILERDGMYQVHTIGDGIMVATLAMDKDSALNPMKTLQFTK